MSDDEYRRQRRPEIAAASGEEAARIWDETNRLFDLGKLHLEHFEPLQPPREPDLEKREHWDRLWNNEPATVLHQLESAFADNEFPAAPIDVGGELATVLFTFPPVADLVGDAELDDSSAPKPLIQKRDPKGRNTLYFGIVCSTMVATCREAFAVAPGLTRIAAVCGRLDNARGELVPLLFGVFGRSQLKNTDYDLHEGAGAIEAFDDATSREGNLTADNELLPLNLAEHPDLAPVFAEIAHHLNVTLAESST